MPLLWRRTVRARGTPGMPPALTCSKRPYPRSSATRATSVQTPPFGSPDGSHTTPSHRLAPADPDFSPHGPSGRVRVSIPQPHEVTTDDGRVGVGLLELLQAPVHRADELGRLKVLPNDNHVHAADSERTLQHPEIT